MKQNTTYFKHSTALISMFLIGNLILTFPISMGMGQSILSLVISFIISVPLSLFLFKVYQLNLLSLNLTGNKKFNLCFKLFFLLFSLLSLFITINEYITQLDKIRLPNTLAVVLSVIFVLLVFYLAKQKKKVIYLISLFALMVSIISLIIIFILSIPNFDLKLLKENFNFSFSTLGFQTILLLSKGVGQTVIAVVFVGKSLEKKNLIFGSAIGLGMLLLCAINIILVLGLNLTVQYPYSTVTGIIRLGNSFNRMDGITYFIYFISSLIKSSVILNVILNVASKIGDKFKNYFVVITIVLAIFLGASVVFNYIVQNVVFVGILLVLEVTIFTSLLIRYIKHL